MTDNIDITISSTFRDTGIKAAEAAFQKLQVAQQKAAAAAQKALASPGDSKLAAAAVKAASAAQRAEIAYIKAAQASARLASASGDAAGAAGVLATALGRVDKSTTQAVNAQVQLQRALNATERSAREAAGGAAVLPRTLEEFGPGAVKQLTSVAAGFASVDLALRAVDFVGSSVDLANSTKQADNALRALAGSPTLYAQALEAARQQQILFGGSLQDNISGIQGLITVSRDSGIELNKLIDLSQRLAVKDPSQGAAGARIALQEAFSGDPTSLAKRYEVPKAALAALRDESTTSAEKLQILDTYLNNIGITSEVAAGSVTKSATQINAFGAALERAQIAGGNFFAPLVGNAAESGAALIDFAMTGENANTVLTDLSGKIGEYIAVSTGAPSATQTYSDAIQQATGTMLEWVGIVDIAIAKQQGKIAVDVGAAAAQKQVAGASLVMAGATNSVIDGLIKEQEAKVASEQAAQQLAATQERLASLGGAVAAGMMTASDAAATLAAQYGITTAQALMLIDAQARIAGGQARLASQKANTRDLVPGGPGVNAPGRRGQSDADILATVAATEKELTAVGVRGQQTRTAATKAGGSARAGAERSASDQIVAIARETADKLAAIDERAAERRAAAMRSLAATIGTTSADMVASQEANDLELVGASEDRLAELSAREQAEAQARIASIEAVKEARAIADAGDVEQAQAVLEQRTQQIQAQQSLDEEYAKRRAELAGDPAATEALKTQYDEATAALADATQVRIDLAAQEAQQRADALAAEKQAVLDGASAQAAALGTTGAAADTAAGRVNALTDAINSIPEAKTVTINIVEKGGGSASTSSGGGGGGSAGGTAKAAGGGTFVTSGPAHLTVGDNPGGVEMVTVTPISGVGTSSASGANIRMAGGGTAIGGDADAIRRLEDANRRQILPTASGGGAPARSGGGGGSGGGDAKAGVDEALKNEKEALQLIKDVADLRKELRKGVPPPIAASLIADLTAEAARISQTVSSGLVPTTKDQVEALGNWRELVGDSVGILKDVGSLSSALFRDYQPPSVAQLQRFAEHAQDTATAILQASRVYENDALENAKLFSEGVGATFETIGAGLQVFDRLRFSDLGVDPATLRAFTASSLAVLDSTQALAERAGQIDPGALSSLSAATAAINAQAEALINLSAVPTGNLGGLAAGLGGGSSITFGPGSIVINGAAPGMDMAALANLVARQIQTQIGARR